MQKHIFIYWHSGEANAPELVKICINSWRRQNPTWKIIILDETSIAEWTNLSDVTSKNPALNVVAYSEVLRWRLIAQHGGAWADATLFCCRPLDDWLANDLSPDGFFAFRTQESHLYNSWFLAGTQTSSIAKAMEGELYRFYVIHGGYKYYWDIKGVWRVYYWLEKGLGDLNQYFWSGHFARKYLKATPYFIVMYLMGAAIKNNFIARQDFESLTHKYGDSVHDMQRYTAANPLISPAEVQGILEGPAPVQKLTTKRYLETWKRNGVLSCLDQFGRH